MTLKDILILLVVVVAAVAAIAFIVKNGGFAASCDGNCDACQARCKEAQEAENQPSENN